MQPISHAPVSAREPHSRPAALLPLTVGTIVVAIVGLSAQPLEWIVEVGWFDRAYFGDLAARWVSVFVVSVAFYGLAVVLGAMAEPLRKNPAIEWSRGFLAFLALSSWLMSLHLLIVTEVAGEHDGAPWLSEEKQLLLLSSLTALVWPVAFRLRADPRTVRALFVVSLLTLGLSLIVLDPYVVEAWAVSLGLIRPRMHGMATARFLWGLPYLAPLGPTLWSSFLRWRGMRK